jgi:serine/threonine protein kinase
MSFHQDIPRGSEDPCRSVRYLGHGASGSVDEVTFTNDISQVRYARKQVRLLRPSQRKEMIEQLLNEAQIIKRLNHRHIITLKSTYLWNNIFSFVMSPVADTDLSQFLAHMDSLRLGKEKDDGIAKLLGWPGCLIRALDYMHEMRVKHRDIKPSNILIRGEMIYFTDFGISKVVPEEFTTGTDGTFGPMTRSYVAPEALMDKSRRGRAMDIFSLGCVFLEMSTVITTSLGSLEIFRGLQRSAGSTAYAQTLPVTISWIRSGIRRYLTSNPRLLELAFLMLDPNPDFRITSRQLIAMICHPKLQYISTVKRYCCKDCRGTAIIDANLPLHSIFHDYKDRGSPQSDEPAFEGTGALDWEDVKREWLKHHMWW